MSQHCILVVEDDAPSRALLVRRLRREGWLTREAPDGQTALDELGHGDISAVLLDIGLPRMSGLEVLRHIRETHPSSKLPVIMVTAFDEEDHLADALEAGANDYVNKPINFPILRARLRTRLLLRQAAVELQTLKDQQELILETSNDGLWEWDLRSDTMTHSARWLDSLALSDVPEQMNSKDKWLARLHPDDRGRVRAELEAFTLDARSRSFHSEYRMVRGDGRYQWVLTRGAAQRDEAGRCVRCAGTHTDITPSRYIDRLTGLPNLQCLTDELSRRLHDTRQSGGGVAAVLLRIVTPEYLVGRMKIRSAVVNDLADTLREAEPACGLIGTGENTQHLILILQSDKPRLMSMAHRMVHVAATRGREDLSGFRVHAGASFSDSNSALSAEELLSGALLAAHDARLQERELVLFDEHFREARQRLQNLSAALPRAIDAGAIEPWWQPIESVDRQLVGFELLARWRSDEEELISPNEFISLAEDAGLMPQLTDSLLNAALPQLAALHDHQAVGENTYVAINIPPSLLDPLYLPEQLEAAVTRHGLTSQNLCIEVTESAAIVDYAQARQCFRKLANAGFRLAMDDFGTGYSSLNTLHELPFDTLKIDQSFVFAMVNRPDVQKLIHAIVAIARALGMKLVAEGVETEHQATLLRAAGVDRLQGYSIARPMPGVMLNDWIQARIDPGLAP